MILHYGNFPSENPVFYRLARRFAAGEAIEDSGVG
jgi:hypothetical protein